MTQGERTQIIAEAGVNHNGDIAVAKKLIDAAKVAGADLVKFQSFRADALASRDAPKAAYQQETTEKGESQYEMLKRLELSEGEHRELIEYCQSVGIEFLSTPFDVDGVGILESLGLKRVKVSSGDVNNGPMLVAVGRSGLPVFLSTGMSTLGEVELALGALAFGYTGAEGQPGEACFRRLAGQAEMFQVLREKVTLLHCTTEYPAPFEEVNLAAMETMSQAFGLKVGYSDHTEGIAVSVAAAALGATVIEKHFTLDRTQAGPDHRASIEPAELVCMVKGIRQTEQAMGSGIKGLAPSERRNVEIVRKSIVAKRTIQEGELLTVENLAIKRPGRGVPPMRFWEYLDRPARRRYEKDEEVE